MPSKYYQRLFTPNYHYHLYNRGAHKQNIFQEENDYIAYTDILKYYHRFPQGKPQSWLERHQSYQSHRDNTAPPRKVPNLAEPISSSFQIVAFCLMPNHFHLLIKQITSPIPPNNLTNFMRRTSITYAMYYNNKYQHSGTLFQGKYKNILVEHEPQLIHLTKYIHRNPLAFLPKNKLANYPHSSYTHYLNQKTHKWLSSNEILSFFSQKHPQLNYQHFVEETADDHEHLTDLLLED